MAMSLGIKFGIILGSLLVLVIVAGLVKLSINKKRLKKRQAFMDAEAARKLNSREKLVGRKPSEGDLFGVRAIEAGYFGGVPQSRSSSPAPSYKLSPSMTLVDWSKVENAESIRRSRNSSISSLQVPHPVKKKPSPLHLDPFETEMMHRPTASFGSVGGAYMAPLPSPRSFRSTHTQNTGWVSPLDVHFSRPTTPNTTEKSRPTSFLPRLQFPGEIGQNSLLAQTGPVSTVVSESASVFSNEIPSAPAPKSEHEGSPPLPQLLSEAPSPGPRQQRSIFPLSDDIDRPSSRRSNKSLKIPIPPLPQGASYFPNAPGFESNLFPESPRWNPDNAVIRDSIVSKRTVSVHRPKSIRGQSPDNVQTRGRAHSRAASSIYSATTSILNEENNSSQPPKKRSRSSEMQAKQQNRSRSTSQKRSRSTHSLARTRDSIRRHSRKISQETMKSEKRRSRDRDQIHYDPTQHRRDRSGSIHGRAIDFDKPRASPFSNLNAISIHSTSSSLSTSSSGILVHKNEPIPKPFLELNLPEPDRLTVLTTGADRERTGSAISQGSIGDFYDSYYRQSLLAQGNDSRGWEMGVGIALTTGVKRPAPLNLNLKHGGGALAGEPIIELPTPKSSPMFPHGTERYPAMI